MKKKVEAYIREHHMINRGTMVIAGVSGGADSVCLLHLLVCLRESLGFDVRSVHVHHGLRGAEADRDAAYVRELSETWKVPCLVVYRDAAAYAKERGMSVEEAGRELRYDALRQEAEKYEDSRIAAAHHQDDQAETILHHLFRGSGLRGLGGMAPVRGKIIRPLLCTGRREIVDYLTKQGIGWCEDSTNDSCDYTRNRLRHQVLPQICREINVKAAEHIAEAGERIRQAEQYFCREAEKIWQMHGRCGEEPGSFRIPVRVIEDLPEILRGYTAMEMIKALTGSGKDITSVHVNRLLDLAGKGTGRSISLPYGLRCWREYDMICIKREEAGRQEEKKTDDLASFFTMEQIPAAVLREKYQKIPEKKYTKWFDYDKIKGTLSVRTRKTGDYLMLKDGKRKTVKTFMIDAKIPREKRDQIPVVAEGSHVLWIVGYRISEFYKITDETKQILQVKMDGGKEHGG